jgi:hypothetical protein
MRLLGRRLSRLEIGLISAALLLPVPLVALNGYAAALPDAAGAGLGSLVTLGARDERSGTDVRGDSSEHGTNAQRSSHTRLSITGRRGVLTAGRKAAPNGSGQEETSGSTNDGANTAPRGEEPTENGNTDGSGPAADGGGGGDATVSGDATGTGGPSANSSDNSPALSVTGGSHGTGARASAGSDGVTVDADGDTAGSGESGGVSAEIKDADGSSRGIGVDVPPTGG